MIRTLFAIFSVLMGPSVFGQGDDVIHPDVSEEVRQVQTGPGAEEISFQDLKRLHVALAANRGNVWMLPKPVLESLRSQMEPLRSKVFKLANSEDENRRFYASAFASYLQPTAETKNLLEELAYDEHSSASGTALDTLFGMEWDSAKLRSDVVTALEKAYSGEPSTMASLARNNAGDWGVAEAAPILMDTLEKDYEEKGKITSIATQLKALGEDAKGQLARLNELLARVEADPNAHPREIEALSYAVGVIGDPNARREESGEEDRTPELGVAKVSDSSEGPPSTNGILASESSEAESPEARSESGSSRITTVALIAVAIALTGIVVVLLRSRKGNSDR